MQGGRGHPDRHARPIDRPMHGQSQEGPWPLHHLGGRDLPRLGRGRPDARHGFRACHPRDRRHVPQDRHGEGGWAHQASDIVLHSNVAEKGAGRCCLSHKQIGRPSTHWAGFWGRQAHLEQDGEARGLRVRVEAENLQVEGLPREELRPERECGDLCRDQGRLRLPRDGAQTGAQRHVVPRHPRRQGAVGARGNVGRVPRQRRSWQAGGIGGDGCRCPGPGHPGHRRHHRLRLQRPPAASRHGCGELRAPRRAHRPRRQNGPGLHALVFGRQGRTAANQVVGGRRAKGVKGSDRDGGLGASRRRRSRSAEEQRLGQEVVRIRIPLCRVALPLEHLPGQRSMWRPRAAACVLV
mmetsp:Transcript_19462/g.67851  ORF Transcript_19462/g.67851 Transcript_19462/m.67851 type:complete len:352 (+) Transcript_19462:831-1886(+)